MVGHLAPDEEAAIQAGEFFSAIESIRVLAEMKAHKSNGLYNILHLISI